MSGNNRTEDYERVLQPSESADDSHDEDDQDSQEEDEEDFHAISIQVSNDSDEKTEPTSNLRQHHLSFDLEEEESDLQRYRLSPSISSVSQNTSILSKKMTFATLWQAYLDKRLESKRKRAEILLSMNEDSWREQLLLAVSPYSDLFDTRGLVCHVLILTLWICLCHVTKNNKLIIIGIVCILLRLTWRLLYWYAYGKRIEQRRQETMAIYDQLNGNTSSWNHDEEIEESEIV